MLNMTTRLAVEIQNMPPWDVDLNDTKPQQDSLTISDLLPSLDDSKELKRRGIQYIMRFLVAEFPSLSHLQSLVQQEKSPHPVQKTVYSPMTILFRDEKYKAETIEILEELNRNTQLTGKSEVYYFNVVRSIQVFKEQTLTYR